MGENNWGYQSGLNYNQAFNERLMGSVKPDSLSSDKSSETWAKQFANNHFRKDSNSSTGFDDEALRSFINDKVGEINSHNTSEWLKKIGGVDATDVAPNGNSLVAKGGAKFTEGAVYSAVRGFSTSEVAGVSVSSTEGTSINSVYGNKFVYSSGDIVRNEAYSKSENSSIRECEGDVKSITKSTNGSVVNQTVAAIALLGHNAVGGDMTTVNTVGGFYNTANTVVGGVAAINLIGGGSMAITAVAGLNLTLQLAAASVTYTRAASFIYQYNLAGESVYAHINAPLRLAFDQTDCTALVYANNFFNIARNNAATWQVALKVVKNEHNRVDEIIQNNRINFSTAQEVLQDFRTRSSRIDNEEARLAAESRVVTVSNVRANQAIHSGESHISQHANNIIQ